MLRCPHIDEEKNWKWVSITALGIPHKVEYICNEEGTHQIDGTIWCEHHAKRQMWIKEYGDVREKLRPYQT